MSIIIKNAVEILRAGGLVAFPTETVYGLGADATNETAIEKVFTVKGRPYTNPLIVHIGDIAALSNWAKDIPLEAYKLAECFWPGPITFVLPKRSHVLDKVTGNQQTIALRMPKHPIALSLINAFAGGLVAPSANKYTRISPTTYQAVHKELGEKVDLIIDGGACEVGLESTIIDLSSDQPAILRPGMITVDAIEKVLQKAVALKSNKVITVPGMHHLHYAPQNETHLLSKTEIKYYLEKNCAAVVLGFSFSQSELPTKTKLLSLSFQPKAYAKNLYDCLRLADQENKVILIEKVPEGNQWAAINDRLSKASR